MPLHGQDVVTGQFDRLDDAVGRGRRDHEVVAEDRQRLVVQRVHADRRSG